MKDKALECLVHAQSFETFWAYHSQSGGALFGLECKVAAQNLVRSIDALVHDEREFVRKVSARIGSRAPYAESILEALRAWSGVETPLSVEFVHDFGLEVWMLTTCLKDELLDGISLKARPPAIWTSATVRYSARYLRWLSHLPKSALDGDPDTVVRNASMSRSIVVVGDIRKSQDLMTYASSPHDFATRMLGFISTTRKLAESHHGFFDKFTGDGFLVYFNDAICANGNESYVDCFRLFVQEQAVVSKELFSAWAKTVRKKPSNNVGLAMGADVGIVSFEDADNHLIAVGDAIVWASRMASVANAGELVINNLLRSELESVPGVSFETTEQQTKAGEHFVATKVAWI